MNKNNDMNYLEGVMEEKKVITDDCDSLGQREEDEKSRIMEKAYIQLQYDFGGERDAEGELCGCEEERGRRR